VLGITLFILSAGFVIYVLFGYPALLALAARRAKRPVLKQPAEKTVSVLLPVRNGERWMRAKLESIYGLDYPRDLMEVIVVCDGCRDRTAQVAAEFTAPNLHVLSIPPSGKAEALNVAIERSRGEILLFTDVRQILAPDSLRELVACFSDPEVGVASGELVIRDGATHAEASVGLYWRYEKWIRRNLSRVDSVLGATGAIYAMRRSLARKLPRGTILDDVNLPLGAFFQGYRVVLDGAARAYDEPASLRTEFRRKLRTQAGMYQSIGAFPELLGRRNRMWLHFVSHKLGRLLLPWALAALAASSFALPGVWRLAALAGQALFYCTALLDAAVPEGWRAKRITSPVRTFVVLMIAAAGAVTILLVPARALWGETRVRVEAQPER